MSGSALAAYYSILDGGRKAKYLDTKRRMIKVDLEADDSTLWSMHDRAICGAAVSDQQESSDSLLDIKTELAKRQLRACQLCERACGVDRTAGEKGHCGVLDARVSSDFIHMGEEPDLVPSYTIFFSGCTFNCVYCQNWDISTRPGSGDRVEPIELARKIERIAGSEGRPQRISRARNVNWVGGDPTSNLPFILEVLGSCKANIPQVWNSNMYLSTHTMGLLNGVVDVYLSDFKYGNDKCALRLSNATNYMNVIRRNHLLGREHAEMIIRHLVLPGHIECCTMPALSWIAENLKDVKVNVMAQYRPEHRAREFPEINRPLKMAEYERAVAIAEELGLDLCE